MPANDTEAPVALVTGGSHGIGAEICRRLAADGARVIVSYISNEEEPARAVVEEILAADGTAKAIEADISKEDQVTALFEEALATYGRLDTLVANAGIPMDTPISEAGVEQYQQVFDVNVLGTLLCMREAAQRIGVGGHIIAISTGVTDRPVPGMGLYTASKAAVEALAMTLAKEIGHKQVNVNCVQPGPTSPGLFDRRDAKDRERFARMSVFERLGTPKDIANVVAWLASGAGQWVTGQCIRADGGVFA